VTKGRWARKQPSVKECVIAHPWSCNAPKMCGTKQHTETTDLLFTLVGGSGPPRKSMKVDRKVVLETSGLSMQA